MNLNSPQLTEAARVLSVLVQEYAVQSDNGSPAEQWRAEKVLPGLLLALDDVTQAQRKSLPIAELIGLFLKTNNAGQCRYSVVTAPHPFGFDETSKVEHFADLELARACYNALQNMHSLGWAALLDTKECRVVGEIYL